MINKLTIIGVGLMGSSLALALKQANYVGQITGCGRNEKNLQRGVELGVLDNYELDPAAAVCNADMVLLAVPMGAMRQVLLAIKDSLQQDTIITDVGSTKGSVVEDAEIVLQKNISRFVPGHPIAGAEKSGVEAGYASLYQKRKVILTPTETTSRAACKAVENMWHQCGAAVEYLSVEHHDMVLAATSHLPHMLAYSLVSFLGNNQDYDEIFRYAASGFRDFTRIASSDPVMWRDICIANSQALSGLIEQYRDELGRVAEAISNQDGEQLMNIFRDAKDKRDKLTGLI